MFKRLTAHLRAKSEDENVSKMIWVVTIFVVGAILLSLIAAAFNEQIAEWYDNVVDNWFEPDNGEYYVENGYLTFSSPTAFTMAKDSHGSNNGIIQYSTDLLSWETFTTATVTAVADNGTYYMYFRGVGNAYVKGDFDGQSYPYFKMTGAKISCDGNIETILDYLQVMDGEHPVMGNNCFLFAFARCTPLTKAPNLLATILSASCYGYMFDGCTSLKVAPVLPATTLVYGCYANMFQNCNSLTVTPKLPATTMAQYCYVGMFANCHSLKAIRSLPATTLASGCYYCMFLQCTSLTTLPTLPAANLPSGCYSKMFIGCTALKISETKTDELSYEYRLPTSGAGTSAADAMADMFAGTGGTFTGTPSINTVYYTDHNPIS